MARGTRSSSVRGACVWSAATASAAAGLWSVAPLVAPAAWGAPAAFADLVVRVSGVVLGVALVWLWVVTTATVGQLLLGRTPSEAGVIRRLVLLACGVALAAGSTHPASATEGADVLEGLRLPDRAVATPVAPESPAPPEVVPAPVVGSTTAAQQHVVRVGDSLWSIAAATSPAGADVEHRWRAIWAANRDVVGEDPDLILPGQRLRIPFSAGTDDTARNTARNTDETGDRS